MTREVEMALHPPKITSSLFIVCLVVLLCGPPTSGDDALYRICGTTGNYTADSTYETNLNNLLAFLASNSSISGFSRSTVGQNPDQVDGLVLCRGDTDTTDCRACLDTAIKDILRPCPYNKDAVVWYDRCLLRYSNQRFLSSDDDTGPQVLMWNVENATDSFIEHLVELVKSISQRAANNSPRRFATGELNLPGNPPTIYGLGQCTPDLSQENCSRCLQGIADELNKQMGGRVLAVRCTFRYEAYLFYDNTSKLIYPSTPAASNGSSASVPPGVLPSGERGKKNADVVLKVVVSLVTVLVIISIICIYFWRRKLAIKLPNESKLEEITSVESILFDLSTLKVATGNFSSMNKLGQGGFGAVYKGILPNGQEIAVKRLSTSSSQGLIELKNELVLVVKLRHQCLVRLLGVCLEEQEKLLIYEYVPNRSLDTFLFDTIKCEQLSWERRYKIVEGIARGLLYLHEDSPQKIIHRDMKASNVLLDADMNPKISDFGLARLSVAGDQNQGTTNRVVGTFGYMAPEYAMFGQFSIKSDVFSFGVLVLEIVTGRKNTSFFDPDNAKGLLSYTWEHWTKGTISDILDPFLGEHCPRSEVLRCIQIGLLCVQEDPADRPTMSTVVLMLKSFPVALQAPSRPAFYIGKNDMNQSLSKKILMSSNELSISQMEPR